MSKHNSKHTGKKEFIFGSSSVSDMHITREKQKARELRHSPWWKKKIASGICHYCGRKFEPSQLTMDHKIPVSRGGFSEKINLVPCCKECNNKKKYLLPTEWEDYMNKLMGDNTEEV